jgi:hypothetical protein
VQELTARAGSIAVIRKWPAAAHSFAQKLGGAYTSMEEIESQDLQTWSRKLQNASGSTRTLVLLEFASKCMTGVGTDFASVIKALRQGKSPGTPQSAKKKNAVEALVRVAETDDLRVAIPAIRAVEKASTGNLFREELWTELVRAIEVFTSEDRHGSLADAAWVVRDRGRLTGRQVAPRIVSRTLLVKGLEFDHAVLVDASEFDTKNLYVAMTRGSSSLTVLSEAQFL